MNVEEPTLKDVWQSLLESRQEVRQAQQETRHEARVTAAIGALKDSIEARDFRLDDHGRRLTGLENKLP
ncbi:MAG: hypothetical protein K0R38_3255 [Polyangiaceae bacterium]|jgi:hypothetical protein|nr:hypothetical protein [Polyangiaceae bacterium]